MPKYAFTLGKSTPTARRVIDNIPDQKTADEIAQTIAVFSGRDIVATLIVPDMVRIEAYRPDAYIDYATAQAAKEIIVIGTYKGALLDQRDTLQIIKATAQAVLKNSVSYDGAELRLLVVDHYTGEIINDLEDLEDFL